METRELGTTGMRITPVGFGAWAVGGSWEFGWGEQDDADSIAAIHAALEHGINWIDTAAAYGWGHSEEVVAKALADVPKSERPYVFTKCALVRDAAGKTVESLDPASLRHELDASLRRLNVETIDLYQVHWPTDEIADIDAGWATMAEFVKSGKVRHIGVSNFNVAEMERARAIAPVASLQPPYNAIKRDIEAAILPYCGEHNIGVIVYSPMASGMFTGSMTRERAESLPSADWRSRSPWFRDPMLARNLVIAEKFRDIGARYGRSAGEVAIAWTLRDPVVTGAIVGARTPAQVDGWIGAGTFRLNASEIAEIEAALA